MASDSFRRKHAEGFYTDEDVRCLYELQNGECYFCGDKLGMIGHLGSFHIDHLVPVSKGGTNWPGNLALVCEFCNKRKYNHNATRLWGKLKSEKGDGWVKARISKNRSFSNKKSKLTSARKLERENSLNLLAQEIEVAIRRCIRKEDYSCPKIIDISVFHSDCHVDVWFNNSSIVIPAPTQKKLSSWHVDEYDAIASMLLKLENISGYLGKK